MHDSPQQEDLRKAGEICQGGLALIIISASPPIDLSPAQVFQGLISSLGGGRRKEMIKLGYQIYILYNFLEN